MMDLQSIMFVRSEMHMLIVTTVGMVPDPFFLFLFFLSDRPIVSVFPLADLFCIKVCCYYGMKMCLLCTRCCSGFESFWTAQEMFASDLDILNLNLMYNHRSDLEYSGLRSRVDNKSIQVL